MKKAVSITLFVVSSLSGFAQNDAITTFFNKYAQDDSFTRVNITSRMFSLFASFDSNDPDNQELTETVSRIKGLKILAKDDIDNGMELYHEAIARVKTNEYEELMTVHDNESDMMFLIKEKDGIINELFMISGSHDSFLLLSLVGDIDLNQISKLSHSMDISGFDKLENIDKDKN